jgi:hypothetical protein
MGNTITTALFCTEVSAPDLTTKQYLDLLGNSVKSDSGITGGSITGGYNSLSDYGNSMFSQAKEKLIRGIAKDVAGVLKISTSFAEKADLKDVIDKFTKIIPDPRKNRKIKTDGKIHADVCQKFAVAINHNYKLDLVNKDDSPERICQVVSELMHSLFTGFHSEFFTIAADVSRIVKNLTSLQSYVDGVNNKLTKDNNDSAAQEVHDALTREINRQHTYLTNLVSGVIGPTKESLIHLVEESKEMPGLTSDLQHVAGTKEFSDKLSYMMSGTGTVAHAAFLVDKALKTLGMSVGEYKNTKDMGELKKKVYDLLVKKHPSSKDLEKYMVAADILYRNDLSHDDISTHLSKKGGALVSGGFDQFYSEGLGFADLVSDKLYKPSDSVYKGRVHSDKRSLAKDIHKKDVLRERLFESLNSQIRNCYNDIITNLHQVGKKIGTEIKITDHLRMFIRQLGYFSGAQPDRKNLYKALSGYRRDVNSEYVKHDFMKSLESISTCCSELNNISAIKSLSGSIDKLIKVIDDFNNTFTKSLTEIHIDHKSIPTKGAGDTEGGEFIALGSAGMEPIDGGHVDVTEMSIQGLSNLEATLGGSHDFKYLVTMKKAIREIEYYFKIANIKFNLSVAASQSADYTKDYENILGEECGILIDKINHKFKLLTCEEDMGQRDKIFDPTSKAITQGYTPCYAYQKIYNTVNGKEKWKAFVFVLEYIRSAKIEMIEAAQALDLYLSKFTERVQSNPDDIKDFLKLLEQLEIVSKWFTDKSGDNLAHVFESFPGGLSAIKKDAIHPKSTGNHYYKDIADNNNNIPGDYTSGLPIDNETNMREFIIRIEKSMKSMRALENIISTFTKFNYKIGGEMSIMSPGLIFKAFMKYTVATSIGINEMKLGKTFFSSLTNPLKIYLRTIASGSGSGVVGVVGVIGTPMHTSFDPLYIGDEAKMGYKPTDSYLQTDDIFEMCIKSMVSKVFTTVGLFSLYNRPPKSFINNNAISNKPLRQILGGANAKIIPEAVELYIRLTLLGEWYRELFQFTNQTIDTSKKSTNNEIVVSMIPAFDGIWSGFVKVIFVDGVNINDGGYTESYTNDIINNINDIYTHYKPKFGGEVCIKTLEAFVAEVNMRYGLILQEDINKYLAEKDKGLGDAEYESDDNVDYDILDSKDSFIRKSVPSDKFRKEGYKTIRNSQLKNKKFFDKVKKFRKDVETKLSLTSTAGTRFTGPTTGNQQVYSDTFGVLGLQYASVDDLIRQTTKRVKDPKNDSSDKKYGIIQSVIRGVERYSDVDYDMMLMFHETVINPLTILYTVYKIINDWNRFANSLHIPDNFDILNDRIMSKCQDELKKLPGNTKYRTNLSVVKHLCLTEGEYNRFTPAGGNGIISNNLMEATINQLFYLTCDKNPIVEMYFSGDSAKRYPMLSFKKLEEYTTNLITCVESALDKFRKILPHEIVSRYENNTQKDFKLNGTTPKDPNVVSLYYIKEHLIDRLIKNKYGAGLSDANKALKSIWLYLTEKSGATYKSLFSQLTYWDSSTATTRSDGLYDFPARKLDTNWSNFPINKIGLHKMTTLTGGNDLAALAKTLIDGSDFKGPQNEAIRVQVPAVPPAPITLANSNGVIMGHNCVYDYDSSHCGRAGYSKQTKGSIVYLQQSSEYAGGKEGALGLIFKFNRLLYHYINMFTDKTSNKIYLPLLEKFANGVNAGEIMKGNAIDDVSTDGTRAQFPKYEIGSKSAVFSTMALAIRNMVTNKKTVGAVTILNYAEQDFINVPEYMKDLMTAYLPVFEKQLNIICCKAELLKSLIEQTRVTLGGDVAGSDANVVNLMRVKTDGIADVLKEPVQASNESKSKSQMIDMLSHINASAKSLQKCVQSVHKELADVPLYFETYKNSISDYKNRNNVLPLMPLSHTAHLLNNQMRLVPGKDRQGMPEYVGGSAKSTNIQTWTTQMTKSIEEIKNSTDLDKSVIILNNLKLSLKNVIEEFKASRILGDDMDDGWYTTSVKTLNNLEQLSQQINESVKTNKSNENDKQIQEIITESLSMSRAIAQSMAVATTALKGPQLTFNPLLGRQKTLNRDRLHYYTYKGLIPHEEVGVGSDEFKFAYGTRGLLSDNVAPNVDLAPGVLGALDTYNAKVGGAMSYDKRKMTDCFTYSTHLLRYATDYIYHKTYLGDQNLDKLTNFYVVGTETMAEDRTHGTIQPAKIGRNVLQHLSCQTGRHSRNPNSITSDGMLATNDDFFINTTNITLLVENDNYKQSVYRMLRCIIDKSLNEHMHYGDRKSLQIYNILDTNIVPINFHALQRELPLINLFNYSYTFDQLVRDEFGVLTKSNSNVFNSISTSPSQFQYPADELVKILMYPQGKRNRTEYVKSVWSLMAGQDGLTLNKPKYLSDQLWNKVLLNSMYVNRPGSAANTLGVNYGRKNMTHDAMTKKQGWAFPTTTVTDAVSLNTSDEITYLDPSKPASGNKHDLNIKTVAGADAKIWTQTGYTRYNTILVRYIEWFVHLQRVMRLLMRNQLEWVNDPIVHKSNAISEQVTEYNSNKSFDIDDFQ